MEERGTHRNSRIPSVTIPAYAPSAIAGITSLLTESGTISRTITLNGLRADSFMFQSLQMGMPGPKKISAAT